MSDEWIKMPVLENSTSGTPGSDTPKSGYKAEIPSNKRAKKKKEKKPAGSQNSR